MQPVLICHLKSGGPDRDLAILDPIEGCVQFGAFHVLESSIIANSANPRLDRFRQFWKESISAEQSRDNLAYIPPIKPFLILSFIYQPVRRDFGK
jgi:hypothetical protein